LQRADLACRRLIDEDAAAFEALSRTRRMDRVESPRCSVQDAVRVAIAVPLSVTALSLNVLRLLDQDKALFKSSMLTDLSVAADLGAAACRAASRTASGNLVELDNPADQKQARDQLEACRMQADQICNRLLAFVAAHTQ
jgi:formiminotetrahydrofolate cyclodeaminase